MSALMQVQEITGPWGLISAMAIGMGVMFGIIVKQAQSRTDRCEKREDALLEDARKSTTIISESATTTREVMGLARGIVERLDRVERAMTEMASRPQSRA